MKIVYKKPSILAKLDEAIELAIREKKQIQSIELTATELSEFCEASGYAFAKGCGYTYKHVPITYDWGSYR
jgi:hypothetical protein